MPQFMAHLRSTDGMSAKALEFLVLTIGRSKPVRLARWQEFDLEERVWHVPAENMKAKKAFPVPLSEAAMNVLRSLSPNRHRPDAYVFPGQPAGGPLSVMSLSMLMRGMASDGDPQPPRYRDPESGRIAVPHGFRSSFRDWCGDATTYPREHAEAALAHKVGNEVELAYRRGFALEIHRCMLEDWARFCERGLETPTRELWRGLARPDLLPPSAAAEDPALLRAIGLLLDLLQRAGSTDSGLAAPRADEHDVPPTPLSGNGPPLAAGRLEPTSTEDTLRALLALVPSAHR
jgi:hypothetical protein